MCVCVHAGLSIPLGVGCYNTAALNALQPLATTGISWIQGLAPGYTAYLFDADNFSGNSVAITADQVLCTGAALPWSVHSTQYNTQYIVHSTVSSILYMT